MLQLRQELKRELKGLDMKEGDTVYVVAQTWVASFLTATEAASVTKIVNEPLVDLRYSSKRRKVVVLKPDVVAGKKYSLVSEALWEQLSEEYNSDWEIQRSVIVDDEAQEGDEDDEEEENCMVEIQPLAYQIFEWRNGFNSPKAVLGNPPTVSKPQNLVVLASRKANLHDLMGSIWNSGIPHSHWEEFKPLFSPEGALCCQDKRVCLRAHAGAAWIPLARLLEKLKPAHSKPCFATRSQRTNKTLQRLESECTLGELHEALGGVRGNPMVDLLLEGQCSKTHKEKWRAGKFFTEIAQLAWLQGLKSDDRLDALDKDTNKWQEACVEKITRNRIRVRYLGRENALSDLLPLDSDAIAPPYSRVSDWRRVLQVGDLVQIGLLVKSSKHVRWREGKVVEILAGGDGVQVEEGQDTRVRLLVDDDEMWVSVDDDMMCLPGTHELSPAPIKSERTETVISVADEEEDKDDDEACEEAKSKAPRKKRKNNLSLPTTQGSEMSIAQVAAQLQTLAALNAKQVAVQKHIATQLQQLSTALMARPSEHADCEGGSDDGEEDERYEVFMKPAGL